MLNEKPVTLNGRAEPVIPDSEKTMSASERATITVADTLLGTDPPIEKAHPGLQPALVFLSYPIVLIIIILIIAAYFMVSSPKPSKENLYPIPGASNSVSD